MSSFTHMTAEHNRRYSEKCHKTNKFGYQHSSKYLLLHSAEERNTHTLGMAWLFMNYHFLNPCMCLLSYNNNMFCVRLWRMQQIVMIPIWLICISLYHIWCSFISPVNNCIAFCFKNTEIDHKAKHFNLISFRHITEDIAWWLNFI